MSAINDQKSLCASTILGIYHVCIKPLYVGVINKHSETFLTLLQYYLIVAISAPFEEKYHLIVVMSEEFYISLMSFHCCYLVDPASSHTLVLKIKPCMSKCFVFVTLDCGRLIITVIVLLRVLYRWIPVVILELIHVTRNIFFYILSIYLLSNRNALALWMIHSNVWRTL